MAYLVWDTRLESNIMDVDRCVQFTTEAAMRLDHTAQQFKPSAMILIQPSNMIVAASKKMHIWDRVAVGVKATCGSLRIQQQTATLIAAVEKDVKIWNAITGEMENYFQDVAKSEICALCLDFRERKFIIADQLGTVSVHNYLNESLKSNEDTVNSMQMEYLNREKYHA